MPGDRSSGSETRANRNLTALGAAEIAAAIREGRAKPSEAVAAHIERIERVNPAINALVTPMFDSARREAAEADARLDARDAEELPPLFGVPVTVKDCWAIAGERFTSGSWYHRDDVATEDAEVVSRLRHAGAIVLGKTNCPDMCWGFESVNPVFGRTNNPRDTRRTAGGSSGGEAAIVTAGGSPLGIGSDIGGSLRNPAANCGCVSLKPSPGRFPSEGHLPVMKEPFAGWNTGGPLARRVEDLRLALQVLGNERPSQAAPKSLRGVRCLTYIRNPTVPVAREVAETVMLAAGALGGAGMEVVRDDGLQIDRVAILYTHLLRRDAMPDIRRQLGGGRDFDLGRELLRAHAGRSRISREALTVAAYIQWGGVLGPLRGASAEERIERHRERLLERMGGGVLLLPLLMRRPARHGATYAPLTQVPYATPMNALGLPAVVLPVRWTQGGLPLSVQVVAGPGEDELALAVAAELERAFGAAPVADPA